MGMPPPPSPPAWLISLLLCASQSSVPSCAASCQCVCERSLVVILSHLLYGNTGINPYAAKQRLGPSYLLNSGLTLHFLKHTTGRVSL